jgi:hypothetical protein
MANSALIVDAGVATIAAGPLLTAVTPGQGMTFTVRNAALQSGVWLFDTWQEAGHVGRVQISSPNLVPVTNGIRIQTPTGLADFLLPRDINQTLIPQDTLLVQSDGTAADVNLVAIQTYYQNLPGGAMILKNPGDISGATDFVFGWPVAVTSSATAGNQGSAVITTTVDSSSANTWYALLGYQVDVQCGVVGISGVDTSQLLVGGPGDTVGEKTNSYFADLSLETGMPCVPLFNAANKASTNAIAIDHAASTAVNYTMMLAQLNDTYTP